MIRRVVFYNSMVHRLSYKNNGYKCSHISHYLPVFEFGRNVKVLKKTGGIS